MACPECTEANKNNHKELTMMSNRELSEAIAATNDMLNSTSSAAVSHQAMAAHFAALLNIQRLRAESAPDGFGQ